MGAFDNLNRGGLLALGLTVEWVDQTTYTGAPVGADAGVYLNGSPSGMFAVALRESAHTREARVEVTTYDLTTTVYTVTIDGNDVDYDASAETPANNAALLQGIVDAINADGTVGAIVTAVVDPDNADTILITGDEEDDYSIAIGVAGGTGALACTAAAVSCAVRVWGTPGGIVKSGSTWYDGWLKPPNGSYSALDYSGLLERIATGSIGRIYVELTELGKHGSDGGSVVATAARVMAGPSVLEAT
jgi:hypothetical protein